VFPYLKQSHRQQFFEDFYEEMKRVGHQWSAYDKHGDLLRNLLEFGGLTYCPPGIRLKMLRWLVFVYVGSPGGRTSYGNTRHVFYSNSGAPLAEEIIKQARAAIGDDLKSLGREKIIVQLVENSHLARRFEALLDLADVND
jgi:hypothetical protein